MQLSNTQIEQIKKELSFNTSRSGGSGGQHVNKVETKVTLTWDIEVSNAVTDVQKSVLKNNLSNYINKEGVLQLSQQTDRSQLRNKEKVTLRFESLIKRALTPKKKRKRTRPTKASIDKRIENKKRKSEIKAFRKKPLI